MPDTEKQLVQYARELILAGDPLPTVGEKLHERAPEVSDTFDGIIEDALADVEERNYAEKIAEFPAKEPVNKTPVLDVEPFTQEQVERMRKCCRHFANEEKRAGGKILKALTEELGDERCNILWDYVHENETFTRRSKKNARRGARSPETWRCMKEFPQYEISNHGRVRSINRMRADDVLRPRWSWNKGTPTTSVVLYKNSERYERSVGWLMVAAGWIRKPEWAN